MIDRTTDFGYDEFLRDIVRCVVLLVPSMRLEWAGAVLVCRRGIATVRFEPSSVASARVVFARRDSIEVDARVDAAPSAIDDVIADVVGYLIGAPLGSLSLYPHQGPAPVLPQRSRGRRRVSAWDRDRMTSPVERPGKRYFPVRTAAFRD